MNPHFKIIILIAAAILLLGIAVFPCYRIMHAAPESSQTGDLLQIIERTRLYVEKFREGDFQSLYKLMSASYQLKYSETEFIALGGNIPEETESQPKENLCGNAAGKEDRPVSTPSSADAGIDVSNIPVPYLGPRQEINANMLTYDILHVNHEPDRNRAEVTVMYYYYFLLPAPVIPAGINGTSMANLPVMQEVPGILFKSKILVIWVQENNEWRYIPQIKKLQIQTISGAGATKRAHQKINPFAADAETIASDFIAAAGTILNSTGDEQVNRAMAYIEQGVLLNPVASYRAVRTFLPQELPVADNVLRSILREYEKALAKHRKIPELWTRLGQIYIQIGALDKALNAFRMLRDLEPSNLSNLADLSNLYVSMNNIKDALAVYHDYLDIRAYTGKTKRFQLEKTVFEQDHSARKFLRQWTGPARTSEKTGKMRVHHTTKSAASCSAEDMAETAIYALKRGLISDALKYFIAAYENSSGYPDILQKIQSIQSLNTASFKIGELIPESLHSFYNRLDPYDIVLLLSSLKAPVEYPDMTIGTTSVIPPASIIVGSHGYYQDGQDIFGDRSEIIIDGTNLSPNERGYNFVVLHPSKTAPEYVRHFDPFTNMDVNDEMQRFIDEIHDDYIVIASVKNDGLANIKLETFSSFRKFGATGIPPEGFREAFLIIGVKGSSPGSAVERRARAPLTAAVLLSNHHVPSPSTPDSLQLPVLQLQRRKINIDGFGLKNNITFVQQLQSKKTQTRKNRSTH